MKTDFGFKKVDKEEKPSLVKDLFTRVTSSYDIMNDLMSFGLHRCWKRRFIYKLPLFENCQIADIAAGTGVISILIQNIFPSLNVTTHLADLTPSMLDVARNKAIDAGILNNITYNVCPAENLTFETNSMDICTISFGLRNVTDRKQALSEMLRVLKPGGTLYCLEFSHVNSEILKSLYKVYSFQILPLLGHIVAKDKDAYAYLAQSIALFPSRAALTQEFEEAGFENVMSESWLDGIVALHWGKKPIGSI